MSVRVRPETGDDQEVIRAVHLAAFPTSQEADLVAMLHEDFSSEISLVAENDSGVVGHVMLSRMEVEGDGRPYRALGLGPIAVLPEWQRQGLGSKLIEEALQRAEGIGEELVFLVGEPDYYRRFGFAPETAAPFASLYAGSYLLPASGTAAYPPAFAKLT